MIVAKLLRLNQAMASVCVNHETVECMIVKMCSSSQQVTSSCYCKYGSVGQEDSISVNRLSVYEHFRLILGSLVSTKL